MATGLIDIRAASPGDADALANVHDGAWRLAYSGMLPPLALERMIVRRGPGWWRHAVSAGARILVLEFSGDVGGYVSYGPNRQRDSLLPGEIYELYLAPPMQGIGFGRQLFGAARRELARMGRGGTIVWSLSENRAACDFYAGLGGRPLRRAREQFGGRMVDKTAFGFA